MTRHRRQILGSPESRHLGTEHAGGGPGPSCQSTTTVRAGHQQCQSTCKGSHSPSSAGTGDLRRRPAAHRWTPARYVSPGKHPPTAGYQGCRPPWFKSDMDPAKGKPPRPAASRPDVPHLQTIRRLPGPCPPSAVRHRSSVATPSEPELHSSERRPSHAARILCNAGSAFSRYRRARPAFVKPPHRRQATVAHTMPGRCHHTTLPAMTQPPDPGHPDPSHHRQPPPTPSRNPPCRRCSCHYTPRSVAPALPTTPRGGGEEGAPPLPTLFGLCQSARKGEGKRELVLH